jgi:hypothetical protein
MAVIRQFPRNAQCPLCNSPVDVPHADIAACRRALAKEMQQILARASAISTIRNELSWQRFDEISVAYGKQHPPKKKKR